jgi:hypothetical protein
MFDKISKIYAGWRHTTNCSNGSLLPCAIINIGTGTDEEIRDWIINQVKQHNWIMLYGHAMEGDPNYSGYSDSITEERLRYICDLLHEFGVQVMTYSEVATEDRFPTPDLEELIELNLLVQNIGPCISASETSIHPETNLTEKPQVIRAGITNPDVYRCVQVMSSMPASAPTMAEFSGTGLDDMISGGAYSGKPSSWNRDEGTYWVEIVSVGTTDTFRWSFDHGISWSAPLDITGKAQSLGDGITITFSNTSGHTVGDIWAFHALAEVRIVGKSWNGLERIETIYLNNDTNPINGRIPFKIISEIHIPAEPDVGTGHTISIGTCDRLGLYRMIVSSSDITEQKRKTIISDVYTKEPIGVIDTYYGTVDLGGTYPINDGDFLEFTFLNP